MSTPAIQRSSRPAISFPPLVLGLLALLFSALPAARAAEPGSPAAALAAHLERVEAQAARLERQVSHPRGRPAAAADLVALLAHLDRLQRATAALPAAEGAALEERRASLAGRLRFGDRSAAADPDPVAGSGVITGVVLLPNGAPLANVAVLARRSEGGSNYYGYTNENGAYTLESLADGAYYVATDLTTFSSPYLNETYDNVPCPGYGPCNLPSATRVTVAGGATVGHIDFRLSEGGKLRGRVFDQDGAPIAGVTVKAITQLGESAGQGVTDVVGRYTIPRLVPGAYYLRTETSGYVDELYPDLPCEGGECNLLDGVAIAAVLDGQVTGLDFTLQRLGRVSGQVIDATTLLPISYADLRVQNADNSIGGWLTADYDGRFSFGDLPAGTYFLSAGDYGYQSQVYDGIPCLPETGCNLPAGTPIVLSQGGIVTGIDFALFRLGEISGTVKAADNLEPVSGWVEAYDSRGNYWAGDYGPDFLLDWLPAGTYFVLSDPADTGFLGELWENLPCADGCTVTAGTPVAVTLGATTTGIDFRLDRLGTITGRVTASADGAPLRNVTVRAYPAAGGTDVGGVGTDENGVYRLKGLPTGSFKVVAEVPDYRGEIWNGLPCGLPCDPAPGQNVAVTQGQTTSGIDFALERLGTFTGTVRDQASGEPLGGIAVQVVAAGGLYFGTVYTTSNGVFTTRGLPDGSYFALANQYSDDNHLAEIYSGHDCDSCPNATTGTPIAVSLATTTAAVDFTLLEAGSIRGQVTSAATHLPVWISITVYDSRGNYAGSSSSFEGDYLVSGLAAGSYYVVADPSSEELATEVWPGVVCSPGTPCQPLSGTPVAVSLGNVAVADFALDTLASISGRVVDAETGAPVEGGRVRAYDAGGDPVASAETDDLGRYRIRGLGPGTYKLATQFHGSYIERVYGGGNCETGGCDLAGGTAVETRLGQDTALADLPLVFGPGLAGWVRREGTAAAGVGVDVFDPEGVQVATVATSATGRFRVALYGGTYYLATDNGAAFVDEVYRGVACPNGPAYLGLCDPLAGEGLMAPYDLPAQDGVIFDLESRSALFRDGFESGGFGAWSQVFGN